MPGIKFALGENVKQSNWGDDFTTRYPQTRMGVETLIRDRFMAAREYLKGHDAPSTSSWSALGGDHRRAKRLIHCHSYRQDEILMLMRVAEEFGFTIGTFQHILEGYKVADAIRRPRDRRGSTSQRLVGVQGRGAGRDSGKRRDHARGRREREFQQ